MECFVYGTLRHLPHLETVLGREIADITLTEDALPDYAVYAGLPGFYPVPVAQAGASAPGLRIAGLTEDDLARLSFYETVFGYPLQRMTTQSGVDVQVYMPGKAAVPASATPWKLEAWADKLGTVTCLAAQEVMSLLGRMVPEAIQPLYPRMVYRAQSRHNAQASQHGAMTLRGRVEIEESVRTYFSFFAFDEMRFRHETFSGGMSETVTRGVFVPTDAAIVLPYDPATDRVLLVEQVRTGPIARGDQALWQLEPIAGLIDPGETPTETAHREAKEEAGLSLTALEPVAEGYSSPGGSADFLYLYIGLCALPEVSSRLGGLASEGEDIRSHVLPFETLAQMVNDMQLANLPLMACFFWLQQNRARLRSG